MNHFKYLVNLLLLLILFNYSCSNRATIESYTSKLKIKFPENMNLIYSKSNSDIQDYRLINIYQLSFNQKDELLLEIQRTSCDFGGKGDKVNCLEWKTCDGYYLYEYSNEKERLKISVDLIARDNFTLLTIREIKF